MLNQIRGHAYLSLFGMVEQCVLPFVLDQARPYLAQGNCRTRAFLKFARDGAKHIHLFNRFRDAFEDGFGTACEALGPAHETVRAVLAHHPLAVALSLLQAGWMTQRHYIDSVRDHRGLDPQFRSLLKHHWIEEAQHSKLEALIVETLAAGCGDEEIERALDDFIRIGGLINGVVRQQVDLDLESFARATGRRLTDRQKTQFGISQRQAMRWTFLGSGMTHPNFLATVGAIRPEARQRVVHISSAFC